MFKIPLMRNAFIEEKATKNELSKFIKKTLIFSMSEECLKFEKDFSEFQKRKFSILFNSGGSANLALIQSLKNLGKLKDGDKVGFSALTWSTNVMPIIQLGLIPVAIDCEVKNLNVNSINLIQTLKKHKIKLLFITNVLGFLGDIDIIAKICKSNDIILCEDNCESLGTKIKKGKLAGNFGYASTFSFFVAHHMSTIEGGMVCTDDSELNDMLRIVRANGWDRNLSPQSQLLLRDKFQIKSEIQAKYTFYDLGYNFRPTEITGFLGQIQLKYLNKNIDLRQENYLKIFNNAISKNDELLPLNHSGLSVISTFAIPIICKTKELKEKYIQIFIKNGIEIRPMIAGNIQRQPFYSKYVKKLEMLPNTDYIHENGFYCGNYPELTNSEIDIIIKCLKK